MVPSFRLVVFDWDGTVMDSIGAIVACTQAALTELTGVPPPPEAAIREAIGMGLKESVAAFFPGAEERFEEVITGYRRHWWATYSDRSLPFPGAVESMASLHEAGYLLGVATAKSRRGFAHELAASGLAPYIHASRTLDEAPAKPAPQMLLQLMEELGAAPESTLMVGDTTFDLEMAHNAGTGAVGVLSGSHRREALANARPLALLDSVVELPAWLSTRQRQLAGPARQPELPGLPGVIEA